MKTCKWLPIEGTMVRVRENEATFFLDGKYVGNARVHRRGFEHLYEYLAKLDYDQAITSPEAEVFV